MEWLTIAALILGPIAAVQVQKLIERGTEEKRERLSIFKTLMRTRGNVLSRDHVDSLNLIPLVFSKKNEKDSDVRRKWEIYLNHRNSAFPVNESEAVKLDFLKTGMQHLTNLLISLAKALGYKFDAEDISRVYAPQAHVKEAAEIQAIRELLLELLRGNVLIKTALFPGNPELARKFDELVFKVLNGESALKFIQTPEPPLPTSLPNGRSRYNPNS
jgi:hypothetical protein